MTLFLQWVGIVNEVFINPMKNRSLSSRTKQIRIVLSTVILISLSASVSILPSRAQTEGYPGNYQTPQYAAPQASENTTSPNDAFYDERDTQSDSKPSSDSSTPSTQRRSSRSGASTSTWTTPPSKPIRSASVPMTSNLIADVAEVLAPSVVNIDVAETRKSMSIPWDTDLLKRFFGFDLDAPLGAPKNTNPSPGQKQVPPQSKPAETTVVIGSGSGMVMDSQGYILTNNHVVSSASKMTVTLNDGRRFPARLIGRDSYSDVAIIKIDAPNLRPIHLGNSDSLRPGEWVIAVGSPLGYDHTVTQGIISALARRIPELNSNVSFIQTDAAINPGNSGGPLANLNGEVIGVNTAISGRGQNIGFAIPINTVKDIANTLIAGKPIVRPWVGLAMMDLNPDLAKQMGIAPNSTGVVVERVNPGSPAEQAGLQSGDLIRRVNGSVIDKADQFQSLVRAKAPGTRLSLDVLREGKPLILHLVTGTLPSENQIEANNASPGSSQALAPPSNTGSGQGKVRQFSGKTPEGAQYWGYTQQYP